MIPLQTLNHINRQIKYCKVKIKKEPIKYTFMLENLKQLKKIVLIEFKVMNKQLLN